MLPLPDGREASPGGGACYERHRPEQPLLHLFVQDTTPRSSELRSLSDLGDRSEPSGRARPFFRSFEENSRSYLTRRIGKMGRYPAGAVDQSQVRQASRNAGAQLT